MPPVLKLGSQGSIDEVEFFQIGSQQLTKNHKPQQNFQAAITSHSHTQLPSPKHPVTPLAQSNQAMETRIKTKLSIEQAMTNANIHSRVKGVIENSKKLIEKLKDKAKKAS
jgi:hypothetical protein